MKILEDILEEVKKTEYNNITNIVIQYPDLEGDNFFDKMESLRWALEVLREENNISLVEDESIPMKHWLWKLPIYFDPKFKFLQFNLERIEQNPPPPSLVNSVDCGSVWRRPVDGTVIEVQGVEDKLVFVKVLEGKELLNDTLNCAVLQMFWNRL